MCVYASRSFINDPFDLYVCMCVYVCMYAYASYCSCKIPSTCMYMCVCIYVCMHVFLYTFPIPTTYVRLCLLLPIHTHYIYTHTYIYASMCPYAYIRIMYVCMYACMCMYACIHWKISRSWKAVAGGACTYTHTHMCVCVCVCLYMHARHACAVLL
jgi:hypothetical protein